jgi:hypothetical protein
MRTVCADGSNLEARSQMLLGSMLAGMAFANSPVAAVHALAYPIGAIFHVPHGLSNALVLTQVLRFNLPEAETLYAELAPIVDPKTEGADSSRIGESAGLTFRYVGGVGKFFGSCPPAALMAAWMSLAAPSMLRLSSNWIVIAVEPSELVDVICATPGICASCRSSGCATDDAMVSGLPPGSDAATWIVGKSTWGNGATGNNG